MYKNEEEKRKIIKKSEKRSKCPITTCWTARNGFVRIAICLSSNSKISSRSRSSNSHPSVLLALNDQMSRNWWWKRMWKIYTPKQIKEIKRCQRIPWREFSFIWIEAYQICSSTGLPSLGLFFSSLCVFSLNLFSVIFLYTI